MVLKFCMDRLGEFILHGATPIVIFDGNTLTSKKYTCDKRRELREKIARSISKSKLSSIPRAKIAATLTVTPEMKNAWILELRKRNMSYFVAPYEADAQIAYMCRNNIVDIAITTDSDMLVFETTETIYKIEKSSDRYYSVKYADIFELEPFRNWTQEKFTQMCVLSGCDYLQSIKGIGLKKAYKLLEHRNLEELFQDWIKYPMKYKYLGNITQDEIKKYIEDFHITMLIFKHQTVYDPRSMSQVHLTPLPNHLKYDTTLLDFLGASVEHKIAKFMAEGLIDVATHTQIEFLNTPLPSLLTPETPIIKKVKFQRNIKRRMSSEVNQPKLKFPKKRDQKDLKA